MQMVYQAGPYGGMLFLFEHFVAAENEMKGVKYLAHRCVI